MMFADSQSYWVVWSALALSIIIIGDTFLKRMVSIASMGAILAVTSLIANLSALYFPVFIIFIAACTAACMWMAQRKSEYFYPFMMVNLFTLLSGMLPISIPGTVDRSVSILIGTLIVTTYQFLFLPWFVRSEMGASVALLLSYMKLLSQDIFACFLQPAYAENIYLFERRIHAQKTKCIRVLTEARLICIRSNKDLKVLDALERIFELLLACSLLRFRVSDQTIFAVCGMEMGEIRDSIDQNLNEMLEVYSHKNPHMNTDGLQTKIEHLENNYQTVLQVTAKEPLVFLLFISSLRSLTTEIEGFYSQCHS